VGQFGTPHTKKEGCKVPRQSEIDAAELYTKAGYSLLVGDRNNEHPEHYDVVLREVRVRFPTESSTEFLVVLKGEAEGGAVVAFHQASTFFEAITGALRRFQNKDLKWREDRPYGQ
jgi:hypothetical protein